MPGVLGSFAAELGAFFDRIGKLAQLDALLLKAELRESGMRLVASVAALAAALAVALFSLLFLGAAVVLFLIELGLRPSLAALALGAFFILIAGGLALWALSHLRNWSLKPRRTIAQVTQNLEALKASFSDQARTHS